MHNSEMNDAVLLSNSHIEAIVRAAEQSLDVRRRYQFFVWTQSNLQLLIPHQVAICGAYQRAQRELVFDAFNNVTIADEVLLSLTAPRCVLMQQLQGLWLEARCKPVRVTVEQLEGQALQPQLAGLRAAGILELLVHGVSRPQRPSEIESFFVFALQNAKLTPQHSSYLELMMPHIHATWQRVQVVEREVNTAPQPTPVNGARQSGITERERQILSWLREGMSNQQVGEVLGISALTVKNHVQKILRKLNAANRAQAVARAMSMNLLDRAPVEQVKPAAVAVSAAAVI
ncbi:XrtB/PEP-CTERM-associated transcriptional regulator EpsA [Roseateles albus]|uniref:LuxR C-terminal-related transcriptional regulator n=1 Tax=Roseateles albus TaxID=2987525 RepID=A0ABT5KAW2_9BURK|nr:XrtB/PEP-CTERM-associated transcriptional regulator EpsA [Roseateles albus]MDC8771008.1 LuxR C-terminal-related transcriptional regulator [Roseateles albus]